MTREVSPMEVVTNKLSWVNTEPGTLIFHIDDVKTLARVEYNRINGYDVYWGERLVTTLYALPLAKQRAEQEYWSMREVGMTDRSE